MKRTNETHAEGLAGEGIAPKTLGAKDCSVCCKGVAHVVFFKARSRFNFLGAAPARRMRHVPDEWQSVDVPVELRKIPGAPPLLVIVMDEPNKERKQRVGNDRRDGESESDGEREEERVKVGKIEPD